MEKCNEGNLSFDEFYRLAKERYNEGGHGVYGIWTQKTFDAYIYKNGPMTQTRAMEIFKIYEDMRKWLEKK